MREIYSLLRHNGWPLVEHEQLKLALRSSYQVEHLVDELHQRPFNWVLQEATDAYEAVPSWLRKAIEAGVTLIIQWEYEGPREAMVVTDSYLSIRHDSAGKFARLATLKGFGGIAIKEDRPEAGVAKRRVASSGRTFFSQQKSGASQTLRTPRPASFRGNKAFGATAA